MVALACALVATGFARADPAMFRVAPELTSVQFAVSHLGIATQQGRFERTWGTIILDAERNAGSIDFIVDAGSINTGWDLRDAFLKSDDMFDVERYPAIRFHSTRLAYDGTRLIAVDGEITLHGVTRPVRFEITRLECGTDPVDGRDGCGATVTGRISRSAFDMTFAYPLIGDEVALDFAVTAFRIRDEGETEAP